MASQIQRNEYEGYLVADPEMKFLPNGNAVTNFRIGSNYQYKDKSGEVHKQVTWIKVAAFGGLAEIVNNICAKGSWVIVEGRLRVDPETGGPTVFKKQNGEYGASFEILANNVRILKGKDFEDNGGSTADYDDGDLPY